MGGLEPGCSWYRRHWIWHETYRVPADLVETLYGKLARLGFGKGLGVRESFGAPRNSTHQKMGATDSDYIPM